MTTKKVPSWNPPKKLFLVIDSDGDEAGTYSSLSELAEVMNLEEMNFQMEIPEDIRVDKGDAGYRVFAYGLEGEAVLSLSFKIKTDK